MKSAPPSGVGPPAGRRPHASLSRRPARCDALPGHADSFRERRLYTWGPWGLEHGGAMATVPWTRPSLPSNFWTVRPFNEKVHREHPQLSRPRSLQQHRRSARGPRLRPQIRCPRVRQHESRKPPSREPLTQRPRRRGGHWGSQSSWSFGRRPRGGGMGQEGGGIGPGTASSAGNPGGPPDQTPVCEPKPHFL